MAKYKLTGYVNHPSCRLLHYLCGAKLSRSSGASATWGFFQTFQPLVPRSACCGRRPGTFPTGIIGGIEVTKTPRPDWDAEALGGSVNLVPRTGAEHGGLFAGPNAFSAPAGAELNIEDSGPGISLVSRR